MVRVIAPVLLALQAALGFATGASAAPPAWMTGVNLSCAEYNGWSTHINFDYTYPTKAEVDYYVGKGLRTFRVPVLTSRVLSSSLSDNGGGADWQALSAFISAATGAGGYVIVDVHQYGSMASGLVGSNAAATTEFVTAWTELARRLKGNPNVIFGLMNEPNQQSATDWLKGVNLALTAIRKTGATQLILVPGSYWDGAHSWTTTDNAVVMAGVKDPTNNFAFEVHQYLDANSSGTSADVTAGAGRTRLAAFTDWARAHHVKGFLGEFGFATSAAAMTEGEGLLGFMSANKDVWRGWTFWAGGPWWGDYMFSVEPKDGADKPQMSLLVKYR